MFTLVPATLAMDGAGGRRRVVAKSSAEDQALDQIAKEVSLENFIMRIVTNAILNKSDNSHLCDNVGTRNFVRRVADKSNKRQIYRKAL